MSIITNAALEANSKLALASGIEGFTIRSHQWLGQDRVEAGEVLLIWQDVPCTASLVQDPSAIGQVNTC